MTDRAELERRVVEAARAHSYGNCPGTWPDLQRAVEALDAAPPDPPTGGAFSKEQERGIRAIIDEYDDTVRTDDHDVRLSALEQMAKSLGWRLDASPPAPGGEPTLEERWVRIRGGELGTMHANFMHEARSIESSARRRALEEAYSLVRRITEESPAKWNRWRDFHADLHAAIDALLAREGEGSTNG